MTYSEFKAAVKADLWPEGEAENLVTLHNNLIVDALVELQRYVTCLRSNHTDLWPQCGTYYRKGTTVLDAPDGIIRRVATLSGSAWHSRITYRPVDRQEFERWSRRLWEMVEESPDQTGLGTLSLGFEYPGEESDSIYGRALSGMWSRDEKDRLHVAPWLQSNEYMLVEWDGIKRSWNDTDVVTFNTSVTRAVRLFIQKERPQDFPDGNLYAKKWISDYQDALADVIYECEQKLRVPADNQTSEDIDSEGYRASVETTEADSTHTTTPTEATSVSFAFVSDSQPTNSTQMANAVLVANLVKGTSINFMLHGGDMVYNDDAFDAKLGYLYGEYIFPYKGATLAYGEAESENLFWPAVGNHDYDLSATLTAFQNFFTLPNNERYYDIVRGPVHFFFLNSDPNEPDGITSTSVQAQWLTRRAALSTSPWKVVVVHRSPYANDALYTPGITDLRWGFAALGIDVVLSGNSHVYERFIIGGVTYVVAGTGGGTLRSFTTELNAPEIQYNTKHGALFIDADCDTLTGTFKNVDGTEIDTFELTQ